MRQFGQYGAAIDYYRRALAIDPHFADAWGNMGVAQAKTGEDREALASFEKALESAPTDAHWIHMKGVALQKLGEVTRAREFYARASALDSRFFNPLQ
jgi:tetratricopeptide (TPR) repeat protein